MKNKFSVCLIFGLLVLFGGLGVLLLLFGEKTPHPSQNENRMLAGFPELSLSGVKDGSFMGGLEEYLSDNMIDRDRIIEGTDRVMRALSIEGEADAAAEQEKLYNELAEIGNERAEEPEDAPTEAPTPIPTQTPAPTPVQTEEAPQETEPVSETPAPIDTPEPTAEKNLDDVPECYFTLTRKNGTVERLYTFPKENMQRIIRVFNAYRAVLPEDGHVFFAHPPFPGVADYLRDEKYVGWGGDVEDVINEFSDDGVYAVSVQRVLEKPLLDGEFLYFTTDHHWSPRAACYTANKFIEYLGIDPKPYESYSYRVIDDFYGSASKNNPGYRSRHKPDVVDVLIPSTPVRGHKVLWDKSEQDVPLIGQDHSYMVFLNGTLGSYRRYDTGVDCGRSCLVIGDSYSTVFTVYLTPYYESVHILDPRASYYDLKNAKWSVSEYIKENHIDDVYFILSTGTGVNSTGLGDNLLRYL